jgi:hypothetical protein
VACLADQRLVARDCAPRAIHQARRLAVRSSVGLHHGVDREAVAVGSRDLDSSDPVLDRVLDRDPVLRAPVGDQRCKVCERPAEPALERVDERVVLLVGCLRVDEQYLAPVAGSDVAGDLDKAHERQPAEVHATRMTLANVVAREAVAGPAVGIVPDPARTRPHARAGLDQVTAQIVCGCSCGRHVCPHFPEIPECSLCQLNHLTNEDSRASRATLRRPARRRLEVVSRSIPAGKVAPAVPDRRQHLPCVLPAVELAEGGPSRPEPSRPEQSPPEQRARRPARLRVVTVRGRAAAGPRLGELSLLA